jgi:hypothetical protein
VKINFNIRPHNGYRYKEPDGTEISGKSWAGVIARVRSYRLRNKLTFGNPEQDVRSYACKNNPEICSGAGPVEQEARRVVSLKSRVLGWFAAIRQKKDSLVFVEQREAEQRANICVKCPRNTAYPGGCASCIKAVDALRSDIVGNRKIDKRLQGCLTLGEDTATSSWIEEQTVENADLPVYCWRRRGV